MARGRTYTLPRGQGSFFQRASDGLWVGVLEVGWTERGTRDRRRVTSMDKDTAWDKLTAVRKRVAIGEAPAVNVPTVKAWAGQWLTDIRQHVRPSSADIYRSRVQRWILPTLGRKRLDRLSPADVRAVQTALEDAGRAQSTKRGVHACLMTMLGAAVAEGHPVPRSVLAVRKPPPATATRTAIPLEDALRLVAVAGRQPDGARWVAALLQGMRQGECLGLTWDAVHWDERTLDVSWQLVHLRYADKARKTIAVPPDYEVRQLWGTRHLARPKSTAGERVVPLVPWMMDALEVWRQVAPESPYGLVWPGHKGRPRNTTLDRRAWDALCDEAEVWKAPGVRADDGTWTVEPVRYVVHEARHTAATLLLAAGIDREVVRVLMGWSSVAMQRTYSHAAPELVREALTRSAAQLQLGT